MHVAANRPTNQKPPSSDTPSGRSITPEVSAPYRTLKSRPVTHQPINGVARSDECVAKTAFLMVAWWRASPLLDRSHFSGWTSAPEWTSWSLWDIRRRFLTFSGLKWGDVELSCRSWIMWVKMCFGHGSENQNYSIRVFTSCGAGCHSAWRKRSSITGNHVSARSAWQWMGLNIHLIRSVLPCALARTNKPSEITIDLVCICIMSLKGMQCACFTVNPWVLTPLWPRDRERDSPFTADRAAEVAGKTELKCL